MKEKDKKKDKDGLGPAKKRLGEFRKEFKFRFSFRDFFLWLLVTFIVFSLFSSFQDKGGLQDKKNLSVVLSDIQGGKVEKVKVEERKITAKYKNGDEIITFKEPQISFFEVLKNAEIDPETVAIEVEGDGFFDIPIWDMITNLAPIIFTLGFFLFLARQARGAQNSLFSFGQSTAKLFDRETPQVKFADVAGIEEAKNEMEEVVDFLKNPKKYTDVGARTPKGVLLVGPSGTGKTLLARAVSGEAEVPFYSMAGSEFMEMLVGVGSARMRDLFQMAKKNAPSIIFIDEIDAIGRARSMGTMGAHDEREQTLNQMLVEMDGFEPNEQVIIISATNRGDLLDPALLRPGRFDRRITLDLPDIEGRKKILKIHAKGKPFKNGVDWKKVAKRTVGFSGADLENMLNEAAILAARAGRKRINMDDMEEAATKVKLGPEKKRLQSDEDRKMTAYHEAGHAVVAYNLPDSDPVHRISIVSRGRALGFNLIVPETDRTHETRSRILAKIATMMGGRAAEELIFSEMTSGAANDIDVATRLARNMVIEFGMSGLGPIDFGPQIEEVEYGKTFYDRPQISEKMQGKIDSEVEKIVKKGYSKAEKILKGNRKKLEKVAEELLAKETLDWDDLRRLMQA